MVVSIGAVPWMKSTKKVALMQSITLTYTICTRSAIISQIKQTLAPNDALITYAATSLLISTSDASQSVESMDQPAESREQGAPVKDQSENHASEAETSLQPLLKSGIL